jgi:two-component system response regulator TctD
MESELDGVRILIVEDEPAIADIVDVFLGRENALRLIARDGDDALSAAAYWRPHLIVLDLKLPKRDGYAVLAELRARGGPPVIILSALGEDVDKLTGFRLGCDDYLVKPFDLDELEARLRALIRRHQGEGDLRCGRLRLERSGPACWIDERPLDLPAREAALLRALMLRSGQTVAREHLHHAVFPVNEPGGPGGTSPQGDALDVVVHRLRKRLAGAALEIVTLRGIGYMLCEDTAQATGMVKRARA